MVVELNRTRLLGLSPNLHGGATAGFPNCLQVRAVYCRSLSLTLFKELLMQLQATWEVDFNPPGWCNFNFVRNIQEKKYKPGTFIPRLIFCLTWWSIWRLFTMKVPWICFNVSSVNSFQNTSQTYWGIKGGSIIPTNLIV